MAAQFLKHLKGAKDIVLVGMVVMASPRLNTRIRQMSEPDVKFLAQDSCHISTIFFPNVSTSSSLPTFL